MVEHKREWGCLKGIYGRKPTTVSNGRIKYRRSNKGSLTLHAMNTHLPLNATMNSEWWGVGGMSSQKRLYKIQLYSLFFFLLWPDTCQESTQGRKFISTNSSQAQVHRGRDNMVTAAAYSFVTRNQLKGGHVRKQKRDTSAHLAFFSSLCIHFNAPGCRMAPLTFGSVPPSSAQPCWHDPHIQTQ